MGKLKEYHFSQMQEPINDDLKLDQDYKNFLELEKDKLKVIDLYFEEYITAREFDLMFNDEIEKIYGK